MIPSADIITIISVLVSSIIGPTIVEYIKKIFEKKVFDPVKDGLEVNVQVEEKVQSIKEQYKADRVYILQFHNGGVFYPSGKSIKKFSMFYESVSKKSTAIQTQFQNIPISLFSKCLEQLANNDVIAISNFEDPTIEKYGLQYSAESNGTKSAYLFSIKSIEGKFIGLMGVSYMEILPLSQERVNHLAVEASSIGGVLNQHNLK